MKAIVTAQQMREADRCAIETIGIPAAVLMERAAMALAEETERFLAQIKPDQAAPSAILVLCGSGNNGGDGFAAARILRERGHQVTALLIGNRERRSPECRLEMEIWERLGGSVLEELPEQEDYEIVLDAIFGIGLSRDVTGAPARIMEWLNASGLPVIAADLPSGIHADTGEVEGIAVKASRTVTFAALKYGHVLYPGAEYCGEVTIAQIGIPVSCGSVPGAWPEMPDIAQLLPMRKAYSNKGTYGAALVIAGQKGMAGAALLAAEAAYRSGTGIVRLCSDDENRIPIQSRLPEAIYQPWSDESALEKALSRCTAAAIGPGLGTLERSGKLLQKVSQAYGGVLVADADALNLFAQNGMPDFGGTMILTPHPAELARLMHTSVRDITAKPAEHAVRLAKEQHVICVLKDAVTVITDGTRLVLCHTGCSGMATGGSGDVLAGLITGLCAQGMQALDAAVCGVWIHGSAGSAAARRKGEDGMLASDILHALPGVFQELRGMLS